MTRVDLSDDVRVATGAGIAARTLTPTKGAPGDPLVTALGGGDLTSTATAVLEPAPRTRGGGRAPDPDATSEVTVNVGADERAVLLVERDGVYEWVFPTAERTRPATRGRGAGAELTFHVTQGAVAGTVTRGISLGDIASAVVHVLRFPTHLVGDLAIRHMERSVTTGPVHITGTSVAAWKPARRLPKLPADRPARMLLLVHGTFSSTAGPFGAMVQTPEGKALMEAALAGYDAVLGYDHRTLSVDPYDNAYEILEMLEDLEPTHPIRIDAIAHSRGGLTLRSLIEHLLPGRPEVAVVERAVLVACTNGGTGLARPDNWKALLDVYTNVAVAGATIAGNVVGPVLAGAVKGVAALAKFLVNGFVGEDKAIPGLAAMNPDGQFIATINAVQPGEPEAGAVAYSILTSDFEPTATAGDPIAQRVAKALRDAAMDRLMGGAANDGVVDVAGMRRIGPTDGYVTDELHFAPAEGVNHSGYFTNPQAIAQIGAWLGIGEPQSKTSTRPVRPSGGAAKPARPPKRAKWTVMVFQAGYNNLNDFALKDLREMQAAQLDPSVRVAVFHCRNVRDRRVAFQTLIGAKGQLEQKTEIRDADAGRPGTVLDFVKWAVQRAPAERYALVLWSHGSGWEPEDLDEELYTSITGAPLTRSAVPARSAARRTLFTTSATQLLASPKSRYILQDDGTGHTLDTLELAALLKHVRKVTGKPLDLLGMDACLMNCIEVAHEVRADVRAIVGSQEEEPGDGWPYTRVLDDLSGKPTMTGLQWGGVIAKRFVESYGDGEQVTQSALDLSKAAAFTRMLQTLGEAIHQYAIQSDDNRWRLSGAVREALTFPTGGGGTQVDVLNLARRLGAFDPDGALGRAAQATASALGKGGVVAANHARGDRVQAAGGISIYFPASRAEISQYYPDLAFAASGWPAMLNAVYPS